MAESLSILDKIIENEKTKQLLELDIEDEVKYLLSAPKIKKERERDVIRFRYGLNGDKVKTLEEIGRSMDVTRERVRQIEKSGCKKILEFIEKEKRALKTRALVEEQVAKLGGVATFADLANMILHEDRNKPKAKNALHFLLTLNKKFVQVTDSTDLEKGVILNNLSEKKILEIIDRAVSILSEKNLPIEEMTLLGQIKSSGLVYENSALASVLSLSKKILKTDEGHIGLSHWREINPKSIKDKTYYILKKHNKPLHYSEISDHIDTMNENKKKVTKQAVHNELIRDERFILIGRGIYALKEWGYNKGVIEDVIVMVLTEKMTPMHKDEIISEVLKQRVVKEATILLNLQRPKFKRVARATYALADWGE